MNTAWTYIISKSLSETELNEIKQLGLNFVKNWTAHEHQLSGNFEIYKNKILIVKIDSAINAASGCSIDKLTKFIKELENKYNIQLLNRFLVAYKNEDSIEIIHATRIKELLETQTINADTLILNTSIANDEELAHWEQPLKETWLNKYL